VADVRHIRRRAIIKNLFAWEFNKDHPLGTKSKKILKKTKKIDEIIVDCAPKWPLIKINKIDLAILRLALYELFFEKKTPEKVIIDEAVELAKEFGAESSFGFVNGVLGTALKQGTKE
jgi:N utilization substance protein B